MCCSVRGCLSIWKALPPQSPPNPFSRQISSGFGLEGPPLLKVHMLDRSHKINSSGLLYFWLQSIAYFRGHISVTLHTFSLCYCQICNAFLTNWTWTWTYTCFIVLYKVATLFFITHATEDLNIKSAKLKKLSGQQGKISYLHQFWGHFLSTVMKSLLSVPLLILNTSNKVCKTH